MSGTLDDQYLEWLYGQVSPVILKNPSRTYWALLRQLYNKEFVWFVPNDDNRLEDGRDLRHEFLTDLHGPDHEHSDPAWLGLPCSMLEMFIALSRRLAFETDGEARAWFWHLLEVLDLKQFTDKFYDPEAAPHKFNQVDDILETVIWRRYNSDGSGGGLFPLRIAQQDQRDVEIWYQASAYLVENF